MLRQREGERAREVHMKVDRVSKHPLSGRRS